MITYPLLQSQLGVLLQSMQHPESTQYNLPNFTFMPLSVTMERVASAIRTLLESVPELHTRFVAGEQGEIRQWCDMSMPIPVVTRKCSEAELQAYLSDGFIRPFDLFGSEPLFRAEVVETEKSICMILDGHHAIIDGMSFTPIIATALTRLIEGYTMEIPSYGMYQAAEDESAAFGTPLYQRAKDYYAQKFAGLEMATLSHSPYGTMGAMGRHTTTVSRSACDDWCREHGVQANLLFQAAFCHVVSALTRQQQVAYTTVNHGRMDKRLRGCVGMFVKTVPVLVNANPAQRVVDFVKSLRGELMSTIRYGIYPFTHFCSDLGMKPGITFNFLAVADMEEHMIFSEGEARAVQPVRKVIDSDLSVDIYLNGDSYEIRVQSSLAMNDEATIQMVAEAVRVAVNNMVAHPDATLGELDIISDEERNALVSLGAGKHLNIDPTMTFVKAFEQQARKTPESLAAADATDSLTYSELSRRSDILAHRLITCGVKPRDFVAVMLERTIAFPLAVIAIHKAGAAYVPIDLEYPEERQKYMLDDCGAKVVIDDQFMAGMDFTVDASPVDLSSPDGLAYMIYTSGSTGKPKGAVLNQTGLWNLIQNVIDTQELTGADRIAGHRSFSFDAHIEDLFPILTLGGSFHVMPSAIRLDLDAIRRFLIDHQITGGGYATPMVKLLLDKYDDLPMRFIAPGGEKLTSVYSDHMTIINCYGPTECTCDTSFYRIAPGIRLDNVPIGRPVANCYYFIVDSCGRLLPHGAVGELCIAGIQVGNGYWHRPELTAEKFRECPFVTENIDGTRMRMYHTGDLCRWIASPHSAPGSEIASPHSDIRSENADGQMEYIGRIDSQVKLRGYRIELGEVEACASRFEGISHVVAVVRPVSGNATLCLYYTADAVDLEALKDYLSESLPSYMVPSVYEQLDAMPLTPNGKIDRRRLPEPQLQQETAEAPATELEQRLFDIVAEQLGTTNFGVTTDLVTRGLSSLGAMRLSMVIGQRTGLQVAVGDLLATPTIRHMAEAAGQPQGTSGTDLTAFRRQLEHYPLNATQRGIYIDWEMNRGTTQYNVPMAVCLGPTDPGLLGEALHQVVDAHSYVKTRLTKQEEGAMLLRRDDAPVLVTTTVLDSEPDRDFFQQRVRPFNIFSDDLYRLEIYTYKGRTWLFKDFHHIISDGLSDAVFFRELTAALKGTQPRQEKVTAFDYALYEQQLTATERYEEARTYFDTLVSEAEVASYPHSASGADHRSMHVQATVSDSEAVREACRRMGITPNSYFQTVVAQVLHRLTRQERLMLATVSNGRSIAQTQSIMGLFVKTLPLVSVDSPDDVTFANAAKDMHRQSIESICYDFYPLAETVARHGLHPEILYAFEEGIYDFAGTGIDSDKDVIVPELDTQKMPIEMTVYTNRKGAYVLLLGYDSALYAQTSMEALANAITAYAAHATKDGVLLSDIELVTDEQKAALIALGQGKHIDVDPTMTFVKAFEQCAKQNPNRLAVADDTDSLTYGELSHRSDVLAHRLIACGVKPGDFVAVMLPRTIAFPLAVIAIHKAGAAYVPVDLEYPEERRKYMLDDSGAGIVVDDRFMAGTDFAAGASPIDLSSPGGLAYMIYTSGSTGKPKGAVLHQAGLWNLIQNVIDVQELTGADRIAGHSSFSFDAHIVDLFPILTLGGSFHVMPSAIRLDLDAIRRFLIDHQITGGGYATPIAKLLLDKFGDLPLRFIGPGGEKLTSVHSDHMTIINGYGPTECTCGTSYYKIAPGIRLHDVPIGRPVANSYYFIVDSRGRLLPRGAFGELCIAGIQVGIGYWHQPELTAEKFCDCPFVTENTNGTPVRMYHTGDLCRWNDDGQMEYIGRMDNQVKIRGYRIELGEVESCASRFEGIRQAVAVIKELSGSNTLCLYYTAEEPDKTIDADELRRFMAHTLADYMVPTTYTQLDAMPLTPNGKIDRQRLPAVDDSLLHADYVAPESELEKLIVSGFEKVLHQEKISVNDDFVRLGGDSLNALKLVFSLGQRGITVADVLSLRTPAAIARHAEGMSVNLDKYSIESGCPLNNTQMFIYNDIVKFNKYDSYLVPLVVPIDRKYTDEQIRHALDAMFTAHPVLTMHVALRDGVPYMEKGDKPAVMKGSLNPLKTLSMLIKDFDLYSTLSRHVIVRVLGKCYLVSIIHHLIFDRVSNNVFCRHFLRALEGEKLDFVDDNFLKVAAFHQEVKNTEQYAEMDQYVRSMLSNLSEANFYRNPGKQGRPGYHKLELGVDRELLNRFTERFATNKNILFTAAMVMTLSKLTGSDEVAFGFLDNGRDRFNNFEDLGLYINGMPIVAHADYDDMGAFLKRLSDMYYKLSQNSYFPFASLAQEFNIFPIILFQFFPDWIIEDGKHDHLPHNETLVNAVVSTQKDFIVASLVNVVETGNSYTCKIFYSGYYSRKMMKALAKTYKKTIIEIIKR